MRMCTSYCTAAWSRPLKIAIIDDSAARASVIEEGLRDSGINDIETLTDRTNLVRRPVGIAKDDLPAVWQELDMPAGAAWGRPARSKSASAG